MEEYLFFVLQSLNVMFAMRALLHLLPSWRHPVVFHFSTVIVVCVAVSVPAWIVLGLELRKWRRGQGTALRYALHLVWFLPVIYLQWMLAPLAFARACGPAGPTALRIRALLYAWPTWWPCGPGLWFFDEKQITGHKIAGLPWEEIAFFVLTSLLVAQSFLLLLPDDQR